MKIAKCENNHYYDADKYKSCPHCREMKNGSYSAEIQFDKTEALTELIDTGHKADDEVTVAYYSNTIQTNPVVGWLVCTKGAGFGESHSLKSGRNFVGRDSSMDVVLSGDKSISRNKHAIIVYDPKSRKFIAQPGESKELFYVNGEVVLSNIILKPYDTLEIGNYMLMFVPFCNETFCWEDVIKEK